MQSSFLFSLLGLVAIAHGFAFSSDNSDQGIQEDSPQAFAFRSRFARDLEPKKAFAFAQDKREPDVFAREPSFRAYPKRSVPSAQDSVAQFAFAKRSDDELKRFAKFAKFAKFA